MFVLKILYILIKKYNMGRGENKISKKLDNFVERFYYNIKVNFHKKILVVIIIILFLGLILNPIINAKNIIKKLDNPQIIESENCEKIRYDLLVITPKIFDEELKPFIFHKKEIGISTKLVTLDEVYNNTFKYYQDNSEKIKYFIKNSIEEWEIKYVLLVGGRKLRGPSWHLPVRYIALDDNYESNYISDLYYADIYDSKGNFSSWDSDKDGIYGEWYYGNRAEDKNIDLIPDVMIGRIPCRNKKELEIIVNKIINYERKYFVSSWFKNMVVVAGDTFQNNEGFEGEINTQKALDIMDGFNPVKLWASNGNLDIFGFNIIKTINKGCGFLYFVGHGNFWAWQTPGLDREMMGFFTRFHVPLLINRNKYPVCIIASCSNSQLDNSVECLSWHLTKKFNGGSISTIGSTSVAYLSMECDVGGIDWLGLQFFKEYSNGTDIIGQIWKNELTRYLLEFPIDWGSSSEEGKLNSYINVKTVQQWILIGDPSLKIGGYL